MRGATLLEWAEPLAQRMNHQAVRKGLGGASVVSSTILEQDESQIRVSVPTDGGDPKTVAFLEARWADSFLAFDTSTFVSWARVFTWRAARRIGAHLWRIARTTFEWNPAILPDALPRRRRGGKPIPAMALVVMHLALMTLRQGLLLATWVIRVLSMVMALIIAGVGGALYLLLLAPLPFLLAIGLIVISAISKIPFIGKKLQPLMLSMISTLGDAGAWTRAPLRADAMRDRVRAQVREAARIADRVVVIAHSQGAAVTARALFSPDFLSNDREAAERLRAVITVGGANTLLREPAWRTTDETRGSLIDSWAENAPAHVRWINIWASLDPVPAGPVGRDEHAVAERWTEIKGAPSAAVSELKRRDPNLLVYFGQLIEAWTGLNPIPQSAQLDRVAPGTKVFDQLRMALDALEDTARDSDDEVAKWEERRRRFNADLHAVRRGLGKGPGTVGPEERIVENRLSVFTDHTTYTGNIIEVVDPLAELITGVAAGREPGIAPPITPLVRAHRRGLSTHALTRLALAAIALMITPWIVRFIDGWLSPGRLDRLPTDGVVAQVGAMLGLVRDIGAWGVLLVLLFLLSAVVVYLLLSIVANGSWRIYDDSLAWSSGSKRAERRHAWATAQFFGLAWLSIAGAVLLGVRGAIHDGESLFIAIALSVYLGVAVLYLARIRISLMPLPERRRAAGHETPDELAKAI